jgi:hypothetical protein
MTVSKSDRRLFIKSCSSLSVCMAGAIIVAVVNIPVELERRVTHAFVTRRDSDVTFSYYFCLRGHYEQVYKEKIVLMIGAHGRLQVRNLGAMICYLKHEE